MKKSTAVTLVISGALLAGCDRYDGAWGGNQPQNITNNTYAPGQGYWHAPYHSWFPYPYNYYRPGFGYYHGGTYSDIPEIASVIASSPLRGTSGFNSWSGSSSSSSSSSHSSVTRGGFGSSSHAGS